MFRLLVCELDRRFLVYSLGASSVRLGRKRNITPTDSQISIGIISYRTRRCYRLPLLGHCTRPINRCTYSMLLAPHHFPAPQHSHLPEDSYFAPIDGNAFRGVWSITQPTELTEQSRKRCVSPRMVTRDIQAS
jgi:hypothetical protein